MEKWKTIVGCYEISNYGRVRSIKPYGTKILKLRNDKYGYPTVKIAIKPNPKAITVHREVAIAFIRNPLNKPCVNHIDGNKENNKFTNLEWCTYSENNQHAFNTGLKSGLNNNVPHSREVMQYLNGNLIGEYKSVSEASRLTNISRQAIRNNANGKCINSMGYLFKFKT